jgi:hypothetical protein
MNRRTQIVIQHSLNKCHDRIARMHRNKEDLTPEDLKLMDLIDNASDFLRGMVVE